MVSPSFEVRVFSKLSHHCYNSEQATKKNRGEWQDFFLLFGKIFLKSPPTTRPLHFETTPIEIKTILVLDATPPATLSSPFQQIL